MDVLDAPNDRRMPISRVRSVIVVYIERKITSTPMHKAIKTTLEMKAFSAGMLFDIINFSYSFNGMTLYVGRSCLMLSITFWTCSESSNLMKNNDALPFSPVMSCAVFHQTNTP